MDIKIFVATHKKYWVPEDDVYIPLHVGRLGKTDIGYRGDDTGENISLKNPNYCELTGLYWAWKNVQADYVGLVHYRRYFTHRNVWLGEKKKEQVLSRADWGRILRCHAVVVPNKRRYYIETNRSHYNHAHHREGLDTTEQIITEKFREYLPCFNIVMQRTWAHMFNMFVMRRDLLDEYCSWLFEILFDLERRLDISSYTPYEARVFGFISELLLDVWLGKNRVEYVEQTVIFMEKQNWLIKGGAFLKRKFWGNKK